MVVSVPAFAQQSAGILTGRLTNAKTGQPLADVAVVVTANSLPGEQSVMTDASGYYRIPGLPAGIYNIQAFRGGFQPASRSNVRLSAGQMIRVNVPMLAQGEKDVSVIVEAPQIDIGSSQTGVNVGREFISRVPLIAPSSQGGAVRSFDAVAQVAPGARADATGPALGGATSPENNYVVNGVNTANTAFGTNGSPLSIEFMDEVQVITGSYMPEFGLNTGGTISATLKRGSNEFRGHTWATFTPGALVGRRKELSRFSSSIVTRTDLDWLGDIGGGFGGPIIKDKLWFYTGVMLGKTNVKLNRELFEFEVDRQENPDFDPETSPDSVPEYLYSYVYDKYDNPKGKTIDGSKRTYMAKASVVQAVLNLTYSLNADNRFDLSYTVMPTFSGGQNVFPANANNGTANSALNGPTGALIQRTTNLPMDTSLRWTKDADNKRWTFEQIAAWHHEQFTPRAADGSKALGGGLAARPRVLWQRQPDYHGIEEFEDDAPDECRRDAGLGALATCPVDQYVTGGPGGLGTTKNDSFQVRQTTTRIANLAGHHEIKLGANYTLSRYDNEKVISGGALYQESTAGDYMAHFRGYGYLTGYERAELLDSLHPVTKLHAARVFLQDSWAIMDKVTVNTGVLYDAQTVIGGFGDTTLKLVKQFSPRVGLVWDPTQKGRAKIRAAYGRYFQSFSLQIADRSGTPEPGLAYRLNAGEGTPCGDFRELEERCSDPDAAFWRGPGGRYFGLSTTKVPVDRNLKAPAKDEFSAGFDWEFISDYAIGADFTYNYIVRALEDMSRDDGSTYFIGNPSLGIAKDFPKPERVYKALSLRLDKKMSKHWMAHANYTLTSLTGNYGGLLKESTGQLDPNMSSDFDLISLFPNRKGPLEGDIRHNIKAFAGGEVPIGARFLIDLGGSFRANSGAPVSYLGSHEQYGPGEAYLLPRGSAPRMPWIYNVDVRGGIGFALNKASRLSFAVDAFNVFNFQQATAVDQNYSFVNGILPQANIGDLKKEIQRVRIGQIEGEKMEAQAQGASPEELEVFDERIAEVEEDADVAVKALKNTNYGRPTQFQRPRQVMFSLRFTF
jgi:hypothetical protein